MNSGEQLTDLDGLLQLARELGTSWRAAAARGEMRAAKGKRLDHMAMVNALTAHTYVVAGVAIDLLEKRAELAALPLVRAAYETAITAQWAAQVHDGAEAMVNDMIRQRTRTAAVMVNTGLPHIASHASQIEGPGRERLETSSDRAGRVFAERCNDLTPAGDQAYLQYRLMSERVHPTAMLVDEYLQEVPQGPVPVHMRIDPKPAEEHIVAMWAYYCTASLVWAGRAIDYFDAAHLRRSELRAAARRLGISVDLELSDSARRRLAKSASARRR